GRRLLAERADNPCACALRRIGWQPRGGLQQTHQSRHTRYLARNPDRMPQTSRCRVGKNDWRSAARFVLMCSIDQYRGGDVTWIHAIVDAGIQTAERVTNKNVWRRNTVSVEQFMEIR